MLKNKPSRTTTPSQRTVLVLQGGGALGAYQLGVYQALHERGIEPDWVIGTSIGAINAALIAGNPQQLRLQRLSEFWRRLEQKEFAPWLEPSFGQALANADTVSHGVDGFFSPKPLNWWLPQAPLGVDEASYYSTEPLRRTLQGLLDPELLAAPEMRLTVGAVAVARGQMRYFDSADKANQLGIEHIVASGALPPAFAAVRLGDEAFWDGGIYSNTPLEAVFDDNPRRSSLIFAVNVWHARGPEPVSITEVMARQKDIQFASRHDSQIARQKQIHTLRHVIRELSQGLEAAGGCSAEQRALAAWGCGTTMHVVHLQAPRVSREDANKDIDFSTGGIRERSAAGRLDTLEMLDRADWLLPHDELEAVIEHKLEREQS